MPKQDSRSRAVARFKRAGGLLRTHQAMKAGIHPRTLYQLRDDGVLEQVSRGVYRLADLPPLEEPDLVLIASRVPRAVICLVSALHYHGLTLEVPHEVSIALPPGMKAPQLAHPPIRVFRFYGDGFSAGVETRKMDGVTISVYSAAKTVADCFKFRSRVGIDVAIEALRMGLQQRRFRPAQLMQFARICRVTRVIAPYLDTLL